MILYFLLAAFLATSSAQNFIFFKDLKGNGVVNKISDLKTNTSLYITASSDDINLLKKIIFKNGERTFSAYDVQKTKPSLLSDEIIPWKLNEVTTMTTSLTAQHLQIMTGGIYRTTTKQSQMKNFKVYDISYNQKMTIDDGDYTLVFLNSLYSGHPSPATTFKNWKQPSTRSVYFYNNIPLDGSDHTNQKIFSNPVYVGKTKFFFDSVEDFSVTTSPFYMTVTGNSGWDKFTFNTSPKYLDINGSKTSTFTTTGFFMKSQAELPETISINPLRILVGANSTTGIDVLPSNIASDGRITVQSFEGNNSTYSRSYPRSSIVSSWNFSTVGSKIEISSKKCDKGTFFVQYYFIKY